ncbi:hypothetical protein JNB63_12685 [Microbacterium trichothecenolyticum]|uniref:Uncharacterized protein n=1 Tax=Microbacterium ureisolvens TaxID=2781186 RepID=A0ABS7HZI2_9MICO|nr:MULTISPECIES: hypothetical protein [Microbacterium]MBW9110797.1 hypothetical protein [Microbacterium ureisolvens]MBW9120948.1 hypothetical protein [Microbacterium trichothecenolyticum]
MEHDDIRQLVLTPLADRAWRLCDRDVARNEVASVIAYVELLDSGAYEAVWVAVGLGSARFPTLEGLFRAAVEKLDQSRSLGALKPAPIPHRPPAHA